MPKPNINADVVRELAGLLDETGLTEIEYESGGHRPPLDLQVLHLERERILFALNAQLSPPKAGRVRHRTGTVGSYITVSQHVACTHWIEEPTRLGVGDGRPARTRWPRGHLGGSVDTE